MSVQGVDEPKVATAGSLRSATRLAFGRCWKPLLGLVLALALIGGGFWWWHIDQSRRHHAAQALIRLDNQNYAELQSKTTSMYISGHASEVASLWSNYADRTPNRDHKYKAYLNAATAYMNEQQFAQAAAMCKKAEAAGGRTFAEVGLAAAANTGAGNKTTAVYYYEEAVRLIPTAKLSDPAQQKSIFLANIQQLEDKK